MTDNTPYVYLIGWSNHNKWYIGARWSKNCHPNDLFKSYFTSSKHVKAFIKQNGYPDIIQVRKTFNSVESARLYEEKLLRRLDVIKSERWLNKSVNGRFLHHGPQDQDHITKRIATSTATRKKNGYKVSDQTKLKISNSTKGKSKTFSDEHKAGLKCHSNNVQKIECPHCGKVGQLTNMKRWHFENCSIIKERVFRPIQCSVCGFTGNKCGNFFKYHEMSCSYVQRLS